MRDTHRHGALTMSVSLLWVQNVYARLEFQHHEHTRRYVNAPHVNYAEMSGISERADRTTVIANEWRRGNRL